MFDSKQKNVSERARITSLAGKITTVLKIAVESVTRELCDSRDYFCQLLTRKENRLNLIVTLKKKVVVYSLGIELFASFMPRHILEKVPD